MVVEQSKKTAGDCSKRRAKVELESEMRVEGVALRVTGANTYQRKEGLGRETPWRSSPKC